MKDLEERLTIKLNGGAPWGFRLKGGQGTAHPLTVARIRKKSKAYPLLKVGDVVLSVNEQSSDHLSYDQAMVLVDKGGKNLVMEITRKKTLPNFLLEPSQKSTKTWEQAISSEYTSKTASDTEEIRIKSYLLSSDIPSGPRPFTPTFWTPSPDRLEEDKASFRSTKIDRVIRPYTPPVWSASASERMDSVTPTTMDTITPRPLTPLTDFPEPRPLTPLLESRPYNPLKEGRPSTPVARFLAKQDDALPEMSTTKTEIDQVIKDIEEDFFDTKDSLQSTEQDFSQNTQVSNSPDENLMALNNDNEQPNANANIATNSEADDDISREDFKAEHSEYGTANEFQTIEQNERLQDLPAVEGLVTVVQNEVVTTSVASENIQMEILAEEPLPTIEKELQSVPSEVAPVDTPLELVASEEVVSVDDTLQTVLSEEVLVPDGPIQTIFPEETITTNIQPQNNLPVEIQTVIPTEMPVQVATKPVVDIVQQISSEINQNQIFNISGISDQTPIGLPPLDPLEDQANFVMFVKEIKSTSVSQNNVAQSENLEPKVQKESPAAPENGHAQVIFSTFGSPLPNLKAYQPSDQKEMEEAELLLAQRKKKIFSSSSFYEEPNSIYPTVEEQVELCRKIADSLSADTNTKSKGANMFFKRVKRSQTWIHESENDFLRQSSESCSESDLDTAPYIHVSKGPPKLKLILDPRQLIDIHKLRQSGVSIVEHNVLSPDICHDIVRDLNSPQGKKGAALFAKRKLKSENWVVDEERVRQHLQIIQDHKPQVQLLPKKTTPQPSSIPAYMMKQGSATLPRAAQKVKMVKTPWAAALESPYGSCDAAFVDIKPNQVAETVIKAADAKISRMSPPPPLIEPSLLPQQSFGSSFANSMAYKTSVPKGWANTAPRGWNGTASVSSTVSYCSTPEPLPPVPDSMSSSMSTSQHMSYSPSKFNSFNTAPRAWSSALSNQSFRHVAGPCMGN